LTADRPLDEVLEELADLTTREADDETTAEDIVALARDTLECDYAGVTLLRGDELQTVAPTDPVVAKADSLQHQLHEGPCYVAALAPETVLSNDVASDDRWPRWGVQAAELGLRSLVTARLGTEDGALGALNIYATRPRTFSAVDRSFAHVFAFQAAVALAQAEQVRTLRASLDARTLIGQAQGVLMERYAIDASQAFGVLRRYSLDHHVKLRAIAESILERRELPDSTPELALDTTPEPAQGVRPSSSHLHGQPDATAHLYRDDQLTIDRTDDGLRLVGEIDMSNIAGVHGLLSAAAASVEGHEVCLDVRRLTFIGVDGVRELAHFADRLDGRELRIVVGPGSEIRRLTRLCGWTRLLTATWQEVPDGPPER
jgi:anti-anti-sigma regulatory factor